jgi:predicted nucleic acid-binding protein
VVVVADSTPLIYLSRVGALDVLATLYGEVLIPAAVHDEIVQKRASAPGVDALRQATWLRIADTEPPQMDLGLDPGETAAILLAAQLRADLLLIDERLGRRVAQSRGLIVRGTLGVLVQARQAGAVPALRPVLEALVAEGFRIAPPLIREALARVGEHGAAPESKDNGPDR